VRTGAIAAQQLPYRAERDAEGFARTRLRDGFPDIGCDAHPVAAGSPGAHVLRVVEAAVIAVVS
jgi:hypothetical protein